MKNISQNFFSKKNIIITCITVCTILFGLVCIFFYRHLQLTLQKEQAALRNQKGILLSFDDYSAESWSDHFDLFDEYGVKVTFFVNLTEPTSFCKEAIAHGHEIGYHTASHVNLTEVTKEEFYEESIAPIEVFRKAGCDLTSFAYPYGAYQEWMHEELLKHYDTLRGAYKFEGRYKETLINGFIDSDSLDNIHYDTDEAFQTKLAEYLDALANCNDGTVASFFTHSIGEGDWCITPTRLEILFQEAQKRNLVFYTFNEFQ